ncbi:MAG: hypothetical protein CMN76_01275 [Spirochaetaceae bacterium]|nr:hypothetical protein [Spirochaetaceae bacterium]|tara:strand:+ start:18952 stop:19995 length:1044 start_codon:yes stop_codon:yes gene_type:complete
MSKTSEIINLLRERQLQHELSLLRSSARTTELQSRYLDLLTRKSDFTLSEALRADQFQELNWMLASLGLKSAGSDMVKKRLFVEILEQKPDVFRFSLDKIVSGERAKQAIQASLKLENLRKELIRTAVYNPFFAQFLSDVLYNGIKGFLVEGGIGKDIPLAGNFMRAGQALLGKAMEGLQGNIEKPIKEFIRKNIDSTMHHTEKMLYSAFEGEEFTETAYQIYQDWASRELGSMLELVSPEEYAAAVECLQDWPDFLAESAELEALVRGASLSFYESRKDQSMNSILKEHGLADSAADIASLLAQTIHGMEGWMDSQGLLEKSVRSRLDSFYDSESLSDELQRLVGE